MARRLIDVSHTIEHGMVTYRGLPAPVISDHLTREASRAHYAPVHSTLLAHDVPIVEHLCALAEVPDRGGRFFAVPAKVKAFHTFPVRAFVLA
jgi:kynurenine formamidase